MSLATNANLPSAKSASSTSACANNTRTRTTFMKNRSARDSNAARSECVRYPPTTLALWARYHDRADGARKKSTQCCTLGRDGSPSSRSTRSFASNVSRSRSSLTARHHGLPGCVGIQRVEHTARLLPPHERHDRAPVRTIGPAHTAKRVRVCGEPDPGRRIVAHLRHHPLGVMRGAHQATDSAGRSIRALTAVEIDAGEYRAMLAINQFRRPGMTTARPRSRPRRPAATTGSGDTRFR